MYQLDLQSRTPIYQQLKEKILRLIMAGAIGPGDPLPSVRVPGNWASTPIQSPKPIRTWKRAA